MKQNEEREIFDECRRIWGFDAQMRKLAEESAEVTVAALKMLPPTTSKQESDVRRMKLGEEIADVLLMVDEIVYFLDIGFDVSRWRENKLLRLKKRLRMRE